jgi:hypothetical protein
MLLTRLHLNAAHIKEQVGESWNLQGHSLEDSGEQWTERFFGVVTLTPLLGPV